MTQLAEKLECSVMDFFADNLDMEITQSNNSGNIPNRTGNSSDNSNNTTNNYYSYGNSSCPSESTATDINLVFDIIDKIKNMSDNELKELLRYAEYISKGREHK